MKAYNIDYEYGTAVLITREPEEKPLELFYHLAGQCFGIRKSIGRTVLLSEEEANLDKIKIPESNYLDTHPELDTPFQRMIDKMNSISSNSIVISRELEENAKYILIHNNDIIAWSDIETKIKSEFDD